MIVTLVTTWYLIKVMYSHLPTHSSYTEHLGCCQFVCFCHCRSTIISISHTHIFSSFVFCSFGWCFSKFLWNIKVTINNSSVAIQDCEKLTGLWCQTSWSQWNDSKFALGPPKVNTPHGLWHLLILDQQSLMVNLDGGKLHLYFYQSKCPFPSIMNVDNKPQRF